MNTKTVKFGEMLKKTRLSLKLSQAQLGEKANVGQNVISQYENGERYPSFEVLVSLTYILGVSLDDLVFGSTVNMDVLKEIVQQKADEMASKEIEEFLKSSNLGSEEGNVFSKEELFEAVAFIRTRRYMKQLNS